MPEDVRLYDLILLLDAAVPDERRDEIVATLEEMIADRGGELVSRHDWGVKAMSYEIRHKADADYRLLQFTGPAELLVALDHTLKITDGVVRFRTVKLRPGTPPPPDLRAPAPMAESA